MGFLSDLLGRNAPSQNSLQQDGNQMMLKMLQERLAASTCPTERANLQNNINAIQRANQQNQIPPQVTPISPPQNTAQNSTNSRPNFQALEQELTILKNSVMRIDNIIMMLKNQ